MSEQRRMALAVVLSGLILFGWQYFFAPKELNENNVKQKHASTEKVLEENNSHLNPEENSGIVPPNPMAENVDNVISESTWELTNGENRYFHLNNSLTLKAFNTKNNEYPLADVFGSEELLKIEVLDKTEYKQILFEKNEVESNERTINAINKKYEINFYAKILDSGKIEWALTSPKPYRYRFVVSSKVYDAEKEPNAKMGQVRPGTYREFLYFAQEAERYGVDSEERIDGTLIKWFGIDFNYHFFALVFPEKETFTFKIINNQMYATPVKETHNISGNMVYLKKDYDKLVALGDNLSSSVDFGMFAILAVPLLRGLQKIHDFIPNYGLAIIILTLFIRLLLYPLNYKSFKSMKKMQKIQPEMKKIKEKYKDDPKLMQQKSMELFKRAGANPMGGCLPMLLQFPVFLAFYAVLSNAVELVHAPFAFWINDLSVKDPFYVLPLLMAAAMFFQQKLMPTNAQMDEAQQKIMMFMPLIFAVFMKDVPSGLTLYILVSTVVGMVQQLVIYKQAD